MTYNDRGGYDYEFVQLLVAERDRLRAELAEARVQQREARLEMAAARDEAQRCRDGWNTGLETALNWQRRAKENQAAIARVQELCDEPRPMGRVYVYVTDVLAAIEGNLK